jgi:hypothetical protein
MIKNKTQLKYSKETLRMFKKALKAPVNKNIPEKIITTARGQIAELIKEIEGEIAIYETQKAINELESGKNVKKFKNSKELFKDLKI